MCLGVPGRIVDRWYADDGALLAHADFAGEIRVIRLNYLPELAVGDYTIVHAGYALNRLDETEANRTLAVMRESGLLDPEPTH
jgi:hydrogenase expression/formation protein HypC